MLRYSLVVMAVFAMAGPALAGWANALFDEQSKNFGSVPRGPEISHSFRVKNNTGGVVTISNVRVSCGRCGTAQLQKYQLNPGEETAVVAKMYTSQFEGEKTIYIYVQFNQPQFDEVQLWVHANSRSDVRLEPDTLAFGQIKRGTSPSLSTTITLYGSQNQVVNVESESNYILPNSKELGRTETEATYQVTARLRSDTPVGRWYSDLWVKTSNPAIPRVRVPLTVEVEPALSVSPGMVSLGKVKLGETAERKITLRGSKPFQIKTIKGGGNQIKVTSNAQDRKSVHVLTVRLTGAKPGTFNQTLHILTDMPEEAEITFQARGEVLP